MGIDSGGGDRVSSLRRRAEKRLEEVVEASSELSPEELGRLLHEVRTYQIELELQNEDLRRTQDELVESRDRYTDLYDYAPVGYLTLDEKGLVLESNLTAAEILGVERFRLSSSRISSFVVPEDQDDLHRFLRRLNETRARQACELQSRREGEDPRWVRLECVPVEDGEREGLRFRAVMSDVTERREAEEQRRELERRVLQSQKLESLGVLAGGIAHDFNNLLTGVLGMAGLALMDLEPDHPVARYIREIEQSARRAEALCRQMLAYAGRGRLRLEVVDLSTVVRDTTRLLRSSIPRAVRLDLELAPDLPAVEADASQIGQVVMNLVLNAAESLPDEGGNILVSTRAIAPDASGSGPSPGRSVQLVVSDTGSGMDRETRERVFEPFFTTKFAGRGLGLAAVTGIVAAHGGEIRVASSVGQGTTFTLILPATCRSASPAASPAPIGGAIRGTVLVVDDQETIRSLATRSLEQAGARVLTAEDGVVALETFREHDGEIDLILLDLTMPRLGGEGVLWEVRRQRPDIPVILTSGYDEHEVMARISDRSATSFLPKPYQPGELVAAACRALDARA